MTGVSEASIVPSRRAFPNRALAARSAARTMQAPLLLHAFQATASSPWGSEARLRPAVSSPDDDSARRVIVRVRSATIACERKRPLESLQLSIHATVGAWAPKTTPSSSIECDELTANSRRARVGVAFVDPRAT